MAPWPSRPQPAAVQADDLLHRGQADAAALELVRLVQALEGQEQLAGIAHVEAGAVVAHEDHALAFLLAPADLDPRRPILMRAGGEFPGVADQVFQHHTQQAGVALDDHAGLDHRCHRPRRLPLGERGQHRAGQRAQVHRHRLDPAARDARQVEQVVDDVAHAQAGAADALQVLQRLAVFATGAALRHQAGEAVDAAQRPAQVVRDGIAERLQVLDHRRELGRAPGDALFQDLVQTLALLLGAALLGDVLLDGDVMDDFAGVVLH